MENLKPEDIQALAEHAKMLALWTAIISFIMPLLVATVTQSHWSKGLKSAVTLLSCFAVAAVELGLAGQFNPTNWALTGFLIFNGAIVAYKGFWRNNGAKAVEKATDLSRDNGGQE